MLGNFSSMPSLSGSGNPSIGEINQGPNGGERTGLCVGTNIHTEGSNSGQSGTSNLQCNVSVGADSLAFSASTSMVLPVSFSSSNLSLPASSGLGACSLARRVASVGGGFDQQDQQPFQQLRQQQSARTGSQFLQEQLEPQSQGQELGTNRQLLGHQMFGAGLSGSLNQQALNLGGQQQVQSIQSLASVKLEQQQQQTLQGLAPVTLERQQMDSVLQQQQMQALESLPPVGLESHQNDLLLHKRLPAPKVEVKPEELQQQAIQQSLLTSHLQRQEALQLQCSQSQHLQAQMGLLQQQRLLQQQQQQQQQLLLLQALPQHFQRTQLQQQQLQHQMVRQSKQLVYETGLCSRRLMHYMFNQRQRPHDNNIIFWRKFVAEYFAPGAKKRWCVSRYGSSGHQPTGVFPQDVWHCEICGSKPGRGFETTVEVLPRLCKIKYDSGILDELLYVDMPHEYRLNSGLMILEYGKAIQESVFEQLRVVRDGQLRIIFTSELKILSWEFCARSHEELLPRRLLVPQVTQLAAIAQKYQNSVNQNQNGASGLSVQELQTNCQMFVASARHLARTLEAPTVNDLGYTKRYVRCLQISEVVNSMKELIDFSQEHRMGPMASLINFPRRTVNSVSQHNQTVQQQDQMGLQLLMSGQNALQASNVQQSIGSSGLSSSINHFSQNTHSLGSLALLHQSSLPSLQSSLQSNVSISAASSGHTTSCSEPLSNSLLSSQTNVLDSLQTFHTSVTGQPALLNTLSSSIQQNSPSSAIHLQQQSTGQLPQAIQHENTNAVHRLLQEMMMPPQLKVGGTPFHQAIGGNSGGSMSLNAGLGAGVGNLLNSLGGSGSVGRGSGNIIGSNSFAGGDNSNRSVGSIHNYLSNGVGFNLLSSGGNGLRSVGSNIMVNNTGIPTTPGGRPNLSSVTQEQNLTMQDPSRAPQHEVGGNGIVEWPWYS